VVFFHQGIPAAEYITWESQESLTLPPKEIIAEVQGIWENQGLDLGIAQ